MIRPPRATVDRTGRPGSRLQSRDVSSSSRVCRPRTSTGSISTGSVLTLERRYERLTIFEGIPSFEMPFNVEGPIRAGASRLRTTSGLAIAAVLWILRPPTTVVPVEDVLFLDPLGRIAERPDLFFEALLNNPTGVLPWLVAALLAGILVGIVGLLTLGVVIVAIRTFAVDERETIRRSALTQDLPRTFAFVLLGSLGYVLVVSAGTALLVVPGVYLAVSLAFWPVFVAVEGEDPLTAFRRSWRLADGNRWSILATGFGTFVVAGVVAGIAGLIGGGFLEAAGLALAWVLVLSVLVETYRSLAQTSRLRIGEHTGLGREEG